MKFKIRKKHVVLGFLPAAVVVLDQITKMKVMASFRLYESVPVIGGFFNLSYIQNRGAAFGLLARSNPEFRVPFFVIVPLAALAAIAYIFRKVPQEDVKLSTALSLVIGGAVGNLIDRIQFGYVIDFLDFHFRQYHFPAFNVADTAICVGVGLLMLDLLNQNPAPHLSRKKSRVPGTH